MSLEKMNGQHEKYMKIALKEAMKGLGRVSPNPLVGAILVKNSKVIGKGYHKVFGGPHAEVNAVDSCIEDPEGSVLYVTLEPCSHYGKTPPCTELIIRKKIRKVFIGVIDPSPHSNGRGAEILRESGIDVTVGTCEKECRSLNLPFFHFLKTGFPLIILKIASSLDGSIATDSYDSKWITCEKSRKYVHRLRSSFDAVLVGKNTVLKDDPLLTVRYCPGRNPVRIVADDKLSIHPSKNIFNGDSRSIILTSHHSDKKSETKFKRKGISVIRVDEINGEIDLRQAFRELNTYGIRSVMVEGGATLSSYILKNKLADRIVLFIAPKLIGSNIKFFSGSGFIKISDSISLENVSYKISGDDIRIEGDLRYAN